MKQNEVASGGNDIENEVASGGNDIENDPYGPWMQVLYGRSYRNNFGINRLFIILKEGVIVDISRNVNEKEVKAVLFGTG
ncbi:hypothetical protein QYF36_011933 [Acer negundo]|nr:hypothetical protein QYF36_011933 [Acer negundo]